MAGSITYPECEKMRAVMPRSQPIGEFIEWMTGEKGIVFAQYHKHTDDCYEGDEKVCDMYEGSLYPIRYRTEELLAEYFEIDLKKVDKEQKEMLDAMRKGG